MKKNQLCYLIVIAAPSGAGKTTLCKKLLQDFPDLTLSISSTTRAPRGAEKNGVDYFFLSPSEFEKRIQEGRFAEWAKVHNYYYGTSKEVIENNFQAQHHTLLDIDVQGAAQIKASYPNECIRIFIAPPHLEELERRLRSRKTDSEEAIQRRMANALVELKESQKFEHVIINDDLDRAYGELQNLLETHYQIRARKE